MKTIIFLLMIFYLISCKSNNYLCLRDKSYYSQKNAHTAIDKRCMQIKKEERAKDPEACRKNPGFEEDALKAIKARKEEVYVSWDKCKVQRAKENRRCNTLPPAKPEDWIPLSGSIFNFGDDWVVINGERIKKSDLPKCPKCENCKLVSPPLLPPQSVTQKKPVSPIQPPATTTPKPTTQPSASAVIPAKAGIQKATFTI